MPRPVQSQGRRVSHGKAGARLAIGIEEFRRTEKHADPRIHRGSRERRGRFSQTNRTKGLLSRIPDRLSSDRPNTSPQRPHTAVRICSDSEDSGPEADAKEMSPTLQKFEKTYPRVIIDKSAARGASPWVAPRLKGIDEPSLVNPNCSLQDRKPSVDFDSNQSTASTRDRNEQITPSIERELPRKRKIQHHVDVPDSSEDELAPTYKLPKITTQNRPQAKQTRVFDIGKPRKIAKRGTGTKKHRVLSIFPETHCWLQPQPLRYWHLNQNHANGVLVAHDEHGDPIQELVLTPQVIQKIQRNPDSEKLVVHKHKDTTVKGSTKIYLELSTAADARQICEVLKEHDTTIGFSVLQGTQLDQKFLHNRKLAGLMHPKTPQLLLDLGTRTVEELSQQTESMQEQEREREGKSVKQGTFLDRRSKGDQMGSHGGLVLGKRKLQEDANPSATQTTVRVPRKLRASNSLDDNGMETSGEACHSIDPDSFYGKQDTLSSSGLVEMEPAPRQPSSQRSSSPLRWTEANQNWAQTWKGPIIYPRQREKKSRTQVEKDDVERLDDGQYLNDNLINFYLRWLEHRIEEEDPALAKRVYFYNTFFYKSLTQGAKGRRGINYEAVERWTSKFDLMSFDYIIVPINEHTHWYVAIICNASKLQGQSEGIPTFQGKFAHLQGPLRRNQLPHPDSRSTPTTVTNLLDDMTFGQKASVAEENNRDVEGSRDCVELEGQIQGRRADSQPTKKRAGKSHTHRKLDPTQPRIITLDSLGLKHSSTCTNLKNYLVSEIKAKKGVDVPAPGSIGMTAVNIPQQANYVECGVFLLSYVEQFLRQPDKFVHNILQAQDLEIEFPTASFMRNHIRQILFKLQDE
ncbi:uncharacterized protein RCO7_11602 [Rhynchosporium graminicola]|uniref:Ubiquitin-like protease family profile domain-containing protein n=1 Tax=Rhynchosporium graminicola TaxID=2792576 RepID=A0A1E1LLF1_9HELO|nr:uncharacterized protein RCO7_11602 [Rhynchosporium commune]